jgi:hypothetical protein
VATRDAPSDEPGGARWGEALIPAQSPPRHEVDRSWLAAEETQSFSIPDLLARNEGENR